MDRDEQSGLIEHVVASMQTMSADPCLVQVLNFQSSVLALKGRLSKSQMANIDDGSTSPLCIIAVKICTGKVAVDALRSILDAFPALVNSKSDSNETPLGCAVQFVIDNKEESIMVMTFLLMLGANANAGSLEEKPGMTKEIRYWLGIARGQPKAEQRTLEENGMEWFTRLDFAMIGQRKVIRTLKKLLLGRSCMAKAMVMLFAARPGNGKTELAKHLGFVMRTSNGGDVEPLSLDGGSINNKNELLGWSGAYHGSENGSQLNNYIAARKGVEPGVVIIDEADKLGWDVWNGLLIPFGERGVWSDKRGSNSCNTTKVSTTNITFILTTTDPSFQPGASRKVCSHNAQRLFGAELASRIDRIIVFDEYELHEVEVLAESSMLALQRKVVALGLVRSLVIESSAEEFVMNEFDASIGVRSVRKTVAELEEAVVSDCHYGRVLPEHTVKLFVQDDEASVEVIFSEPEESSDDEPEMKAEQDKEPEKVVRKQVMPTANDEPIVENSRKHRSKAQKRAERRRRNRRG
jgi:DNA polymerase III delta prime subunit